MLRKTTQYLTKYNKEFMQRHKTLQYFSTTINMKNQNYYEILGIERTADIKQIKKAFRNLGIF